MTLEPRVQEFLERYPDDLTDAELTELRAAAEADPDLEDLLDAILMTDAALTGAPEASPSLSDAGRDRLASRLEDAGVQAWSTGGATPSGNVIEGPKSWSTGGATPSGSAQEGPSAWSTGGATPSGSADITPPGVTDLNQARRRRRMTQHPGFLAVAAMFLVAVGFVVRDNLTPPVQPEFTFKGDGTEGAIRGSLFVQGDQRLTGGEARPVDAPIRFRAVMSDAASLALLETQNGKTFVLWPPPGKEWRVAPGTHLLQPGGKGAEYRPAQAGEARYTLIAIPSRFDIPPDREVESPEAFGSSHEGAVGLDDLVVRWEEPAP